jgi:hypothetical protein
MTSYRAAVLAAAALLAACAGPRLTPAITPIGPNQDALLVLPGFGYSRGDAGGFRSVARSAAGAGLDVYVPAYVTRDGLEANRRALRAFIREQRLDRYARVHVFAFIAGAWTVNPLIDAGALPNLATVVYDRSPFQERAPRIAVRDLRIAAWLRYGSTIFDVARTPYPALARPDVKVALLVETRPTEFIVHHAKDVAAAGLPAFDCESFRQRHDDCAYVPLNHDELYARFADVWPDVEAFIRTGRFPGDADRMPPADPARLLARVR